MSCNTIDKFFDNYVKAGDTAASFNELNLLSKHADPRIRRRVAENVRTSEKILTRLSLDENTDVRIAVGTNPVAPHAIKQLLSEDPDATVRLGLAHDVLMPEDILQILLEDNNAWVSGEARRTLEIVAHNRRLVSGCAEFSDWKKRKDERSARLG